MNWVKPACLPQTDYLDFDGYRYILYSRPASVAELEPHPPGVGEVMGSILDPNCVIPKGVKSCTYCCYVRCEKLIVEVGGIPWPKQAQLNTMHS